jgi:hypothetical protein
LANNTTDALAKNITDALAKNTADALAKNTTDALAKNTTDALAKNITDALAKNTTDALAKNIRLLIACPSTFLYFALGAYNKKPIAVHIVFTQHACQLSMAQSDLLSSAVRCATAAAICCCYSRPNDYTFHRAVLRNCATVHFHESDLFVNETTFLSVFVNEATFLSVCLLF